MESKFKYTLEIWFRDKLFEKDFMTREVIAENYESAKEKAKSLRRNIFDIKIINKEPYDGDKI